MNAVKTTPLAGYQKTNQVMMQIQQTAVQSHMPHTNTNAGQTMQQGNFNVSMARVLSEIASKHQKVKILDFQSRWFSLGNEDNYYLLIMICDSDGWFSWLLVPTVIIDLKRVYLPFSIFLCLFVLRFLFVQFHQKYLPKMQNVIIH